MKRLHVYSALLLTAFSSGLSAQAPSYDAALLELARDAAGMTPGEAPLAVRFGPVVRFPVSRSYLLEIESAEQVTAVHGAFQITYPDGAVIVDGAGPKEIIGGGANFRQPAFDSLVMALRSASLIVATHEHHDHVGGLVSGTHVAETSRRTLLTTQQLETLTRAPNREAVRITHEQADRFTEVSYDRVLPLAPGVALVRTAGHTPGSQSVFVRLASGTELLLVGDIVWTLEGVTGNLQKPTAESEALGEDRGAISAQLAWLRLLMDEGVIIIPAHDLGVIEDLILSGTIQHGFYLPH